MGKMSDNIIFASYALKYHIYMINNELIYHKNSRHIYNKPLQIPETISNPFMHTQV